MDQDPGPHQPQGTPAPDTRPRVFVGVTGSVTSLQALRCAVDEARRMRAVLHVVRVWFPPRVAGLAAMVACAPTPWLQQTRESMTTAFEEALGGVPHDLDVRVRLIEGEAGVELVRVANRPDDLLVVGAGRGGFFYRITHGAVAGYCVNHASCPVLVVPPPVLARDARHGRFFDHMPSYVPESLLEETLGGACGDQLAAGGQAEANGPAHQGRPPATDRSTQTGKAPRRQRGPHWPPRQ